MSDFHDVLFPTKLALGAIGGPYRNTNIQARANGYETRNISNLHSLRRWEIATKGSTLDELHETIAFFEARMGRAYSFRFKDPMDNKSCAPSNSPTAFDILIAFGDGLKTEFQIIKTYGDAQNSYNRPIKTLVNNSVLVSIAGVICNPDIYQINHTEGKIIFNNPPADDSQIKVGYLFDNKVRFDNDSLEIILDSAKTGRINNIILQEVL